MISGEAGGSRVGEDSARLFTGVAASGQARPGPFCSTRGLPLMPPNFRENTVSYKYNSKPETELPNAVLWIRDILIRIRIRSTDLRIRILLFSSVTFKNQDANKIY
jgi:hypothetical protein